MTSTLPALGAGSFWQEYMRKQVGDLVARTKAVGFEPDTEDGRAFLIDEAIKWDLSIHDPRITLYIKRYFWTEIYRLTGIGVDSDYVADALEREREERKREKHDKLVVESLLDAYKLAEEGDFVGAKGAVQEGLTKADSALAGKPAEPIISVSDALGSLRADLLSTQGLRYTGMVQKTIPELDDATNGFQGLTLITGKSGCGKTILALQNGLDLLTYQPDTCLLFVSADMDRQRVMRRLVSNRARLELNTVRCGTGPDGWTPQEKAAIDRAFDELAQIGRRMRVLDRFNFPHTTKGNILREKARLLDETGAERCILLIDFLELLYCPENLKLEADQDNYRIEAVRELTDEDPQGVVIAITESTKSQVNYERGSAENVKGTQRKIMRSDVIITLNEFIDDEINTYYDINNDYVMLRQKKEPYTEKDAKPRAKQIRKLLSAKGQAPIMVKLGKARDGAKKVDFNVVNHFEKNMFTPLGK